MQHSHNKLMDINILNKIVDKVSYNNKCMDNKHKIIPNNICNNNQ